MSDAPLFDDAADMPNYWPHFDGDTYDAVDYDKFSRQLKNVFDVMKDGQWHSISMIARSVGCSQQSASARLRDLRKAKFGAYNMERQRMKSISGTYVYRLVGSKGDGEPQRKACHGCDERDAEILRLQSLLQSRVS
jgi:DNA-binding Lrp family transcriptional regulator